MYNSLCKSISNRAVGVALTQKRKDPKTRFQQPMQSHGVAISSIPAFPVGIFAYACRSPSSSCSRVAHPFPHACRPPGARPAAAEVAPGGGRRLLSSLRELGPGPAAELGPAGGEARTRRRRRARGGSSDPDRRSSTRAAAFAGSRREGGYGRGWERGDLKS